MRPTCWTLPSFLALPSILQYSMPFEPLAAAEDCGNPSLSTLLTGERRDVPLFLVDMPTGMGGGAELEYLELRLLELQGIADLHVVAESGYTFRGDKKMRLFRENRKRYEADERAFKRL